MLPRTHDAGRLCAAALRGVAGHGPAANRGRFGLGLLDRSRARAQRRLHAPAQGALRRGVPRWNRAARGGGRLAQGARAHLLVNANDAAHLHRLVARAQLPRQLGRRRQAQLVRGGARAGHRPDLARNGAAGPALVRVWPDQARL